MYDKSKEAVYLTEISQLNPYIRAVNRVVGAKPQSHVIPWRILYDFEMVFVTKGKLRVIKEDASYTINAGCLHIMPPFVRYKRKVPHGEVADYFSVHLDFVFDENSPDFSVEEVYQVHCDNKLSVVSDDEELAEARKNLKSSIAGFVENHKVENMPRFTELFNQLYETYARKGLCDRLNLKAYMILIIAEIVRELESRSKTTLSGADFVMQFINYVTRNYADEIDLDAIVKDFGVSPSRFRVIFKTRMNTTPWDYVINCRIEQAKHLLLTGRYNMSEVSYMVGYDNIHYFSRLFKSKAGCSPTAFMKNG
ncbi:MAG: helix-turn-helix transcriptional regulator [Clostridia bacterium]|nr:helix-turn-helix transcriptional regulator [Clostridia bacterium]